MAKDRKPGIYRAIFSYMWSDPWFEKLKQDEKLLFIYLVTNSHSSIAGLYEITKRVMAFETGISLTRIDEILKSLDADGRVMYDDDSTIVWVKNMHKYQVNTSPKQLKRAENDVMLVPNCRVKKLYIDYYYGAEAYVEPPPQPKLKQVFSPFVEENKNVDFMEAIDVYSNVTGNMAFPQQSIDADIYRIGKLIGVHGDKTVEYLKPYWAEWTNRKYSKTNTAWLDWAIAGEIPRRKGNNKPAVEKYKLPDNYDYELDEIDSEPEETDNASKSDTRWETFVEQHIKDMRWRSLLKYGGETDGKVVIYAPEAELQKAQAIFGKTLERYYMGNVVIEGMPS